MKNPLIYTALSASGIQSQFNKCILQSRKAVTPELLDLLEAMPVSVRDEARWSIFEFSCLYNSTSLLDLSFSLGLQDDPRLVESLDVANLLRDSYFRGSNFGSYGSQDSHLELLKNCAKHHGERFILSSIRSIYDGHYLMKKAGVKYVSNADLGESVGKCLNKLVLFVSDEIYTNKFICEEMSEYLTKYDFNPHEIFSKFKCNIEHIASCSIDNIKKHYADHFMSEFRHKYRNEDEISSKVLNAAISLALPEVANLLLHANDNAYSDAITLKFIRLIQSHWREIFELDFEEVDKIIQITSRAIQNPYLADSVSSICKSSPSIVCLHALDQYNESYAKEIGNDMEKLWSSRDGNLQGFEGMIAKGAEFLKKCLGEKFIKTYSLVWNKPDLRGKMLPPEKLSDDEKYIHVAVRLALELNTNGSARFGSKPIEYIAKRGNSSNGWESYYLPQTCNAILRTCDPKTIVDIVKKGSAQDIYFDYLLQNGFLGRDCLTLLPAAKRKKYLETDMGL